MKTKKMVTIRPKATKRKMRFGKHVEGAVFAAIMFIILSMMLLAQGDRVSAVEKHLARLQDPMYRKTQQEQAQQVKDLQSQATSCKTSLDACTSSRSNEAVFLKGLLSEPNLDVRLLSSILYTKLDPKDPLKGDTIGVLIHHNNPLDGKILVVYGLNAREGLGFFVRDGSKLLDEGFFVGGPDGQGRIRNVQWQNGSTVEYDRIVDDETTHERYTLK